MNPKLPVILLDACVLYPYTLRDTLMHLALARLYTPCWTDRIHEEWHRNVLKNSAFRYTPSQPKSEILVPTPPHFFPNRDFFAPKKNPSPITIYRIGELRLQRQVFRASGLLCSRQNALMCAFRHAQDARSPSLLKFAPQ